jgi:hypothetical protein
MAPASWKAFFEDVLEQDKLSEARKQVAERINSRLGCQAVVRDKARRWYLAQEPLKKSDSEVSRRLLTELKHLTGPERNKVQTTLPTLIEFLDRIDIIQPGMEHSTPQKDRTAHGEAHGETPHPKTPGPTSGHRHKSLRERLEQVKQSPHKRKLSEYRSDIIELNEEIKSLNEEEEQQELEMMNNLEELSTKAGELAELVNVMTQGKQQLSQRNAVRQDKRRCKSN